MPHSSSPISELGDLIRAAITIIVMVFILGVLYAAFKDTGINTGLFSQTIDLLIFGFVVIFVIAIIAFLYKFLNRDSG